MSAQQPPSWGSSYRLIAAEKWRKKSATMGRAVTEALVEYASPLTGMRVLDIASGTGEPAISIAQRVGAEGHVVALDLSVELLKLAEQRAQQRALINFETRQADAHALPFEDRSFDLATCRFGVMFFTRVEDALKDLRRVLKPGARACFAAWGSFDQPYWQSTMKIVHQHVGGSLLDPAGSDPFRFAAPGSLSAKLHIAGFQDVEESTRKVPWTWPGSTDEVFEYARACSTPFQPMLARVPEDMWPSILADIHAAIDQYRVGDEVRFGAEVVFASGKA